MADSARSDQRGNTYRYTRCGGIGRWRRIREIQKNRSFAQKEDSAIREFREISRARAKRFSNSNLAPNLREIFPKIEFLARRNRFARARIHILREIKFPARAKFSRKIQMFTIVRARSFRAREAAIREIRALQRGRPGVVPGRRDLTLSALQRPADAVCFAGSILPPLRATAASLPPLPSTPAPRPPRRCSGPGISPATGAAAAGTAQGRPVGGPSPPIPYGRREAARGSGRGSAHVPATHPRGRPLIAAGLASLHSGPGVRRRSRPNEGGRGEPLHWFGRSML